MSYSDDVELNPAKYTFAKIESCVDIQITKAFLWALGHKKNDPRVGQPEPLHDGILRRKFVLVNSLL